MRRRWVDAINLYLELSSENYIGGSFRDQLAMIIAQEGWLPHLTGNGFSLDMRPTIMFLGPRRLSLDLTGVTEARLVELLDAAAALAQSRGEELPEI